MLISFTVAMPVAIHMGATERPWGTQEKTRKPCESHKQQMLACTITLISCNGTEKPNQKSHENQANLGDIAGKKFSVCSFF
ncbi:hypothetical protein [Pseudomonas syringae]|uniref:hypothetical protein n=1 Tax=Pseudomonas syringae TaxID=317 RepID=UPI0012696102|nr:hypothetical protein [Pseudomonas syringae]